MLCFFNTPTPRIPSDPQFGIYSRQLRSTRHGPSTTETSQSTSHGAPATEHQPRSPTTEAQSRSTSHGAPATLSGHQPWSFEHGKLAMEHQPRSTSHSPYCHGAPATEPQPGRLPQHQPRSTSHGAPTPPTRHGAPATEHQLRSPNITTRTQQERQESGSK